jgi:hypothetical protein
MFDKFEFSDIYKFISSIGITFVAFAFAIPIILFQIDVLKYYKTDNFNKFPETIHKSIEIQQSLVYYSLKFWWAISSVFLILGFSIFLYGICRWKKRQNVLDKIQDLDLESKENNIKIANKTEINTKIKEDAEEINSAGKDRLSFISSYKSIERKIFDATQIYKPNIKITRNAKVGKYIYDLIIIKRISAIKRIHKVCEIKYYQNSLLYSTIQHGIANFLLSISNYKNEISVDDRRIEFEFFMIWICKDSVFNILKAYSIKAKQFSKNKGINLKIIILHEKDIDNIYDKLL